MKTRSISPIVFFALKDWIVSLNCNLFTEGIWYFLFRIPHKSNFELIFVYFIKKYKSQFEFSGNWISLFLVLLGLS